MKAALIPVAQDRLREYVRNNPKASNHDCASWLNNQRADGERLTMHPGEVARVVQSVRRAVPPGQKPLPVEVGPRDVRETLRAPLAEVARFVPVAVKPVERVHGMSEAAIKTRPARLARVEELVLEHPEWIHADVEAQLIKEFGCSIDSSVIGAALKLAREAAGLPYHTKTRRPKEAMPALVAPAVQIPPDELLKEAGRVLKALAQRMQWATVTVKVTHDGTLTYSSEPMPALSVKGEMKL